MDSKNRNIKIAIVLVFGVVCFALGRWLSPEKVKIQREVVVKEDTTKIEQLKTDLERLKKKKTTTVEVIRPDGTREIKTVVKEDESVRKQKSKDTTTTIVKETSEKESKEITNSSSVLTLSALVGTDITSLSSSSKLQFGAHVQRTIIGPFTLGVFGLSSGTAGFSLGLSIK